MANYKKDPAYFSSWEAGECTDKNTIFLNLRGNSDKRFSHFHMSKEDTQILINDLQMLLDNKEERRFLRAEYNIDKK